MRPSGLLAYLALHIYLLVLPLLTTRAHCFFFPPLAAVDHPHSFSCKLELGSDQEIPSDWYPFVSMECEISGAVVSQTRVKSLGTVNDIQPQKHVTSWTRYHCQVRRVLRKLHYTRWIKVCGHMLRDGTKINYFRAFLTLIVIPDLNCSTEKQTEIF